MAFSFFLQRLTPGFHSFNLFVCVQSLSCVQLFATPWTVAHQAPLSMEFSRQEYWSGLPFPSPGILAQESNLRLLYWQADSLPLSHQGSPNLLSKYLLSIYYSKYCPSYLFSGEQTRQI